MIVEFFKGSQHVDGKAVPFILAIMEDSVWKHSENFIASSIAQDHKLLPDCKKIAEVDFLDTEMEAVETLVDALVASGILIKNSGISGESALYILVNETLVVLQGLMDEDETVMSEDFRLTENE